MRQSNYPKPSWKVRRRIIFATLFFCAVCIIHVLISDDKRPVTEVIVVSSFGTALAVIGSYIFGAVWDDSNYMTAVKPKRDVAPDEWDGADSAYPETID